MFWILGLLISLFIMYSDYAHYFYTKRHGKKSKVPRLLITVTLPMLAATEILNELGAGEVAYQVCVIIVSALVGLLVCLSEQYRFKAERD